MFAVVGDGCFMMTCMEIVTAVSLGLGIVYYVFHDGELAQIAQAQRLPYRRAPCTQIGAVDLCALAQATGARFVGIANDAQLASAIAQARGMAAGNRPVIVDVAVDYSRPTAFTTGTIRTNFHRFPLAQKARIVGRMVRRSLAAPGR